MISRFWIGLLPLACGTLLAGCSSSPAPESAAPPPSGPASTIHSSTPVAGASDSVGSIPGSPGARYIYRFRQTLPASEAFNFQDRDLSFYFRPAPEALFIQIENRQNRPVWIQWEKCTFYDPHGNSGKVAHASTRWDDRFKAQADSQIPGLGHYGDYVLPLDYLYDPAGADQQLHRPLLPEDSTSPTYANDDFGVDLAFLIEDRPRVYNFRFKVAQVIPR